MSERVPPRRHDPAWLQILSQMYHILLYNCLICSSPLIESVRMKAFLVLLLVCVMRSCLGHLCIAYDLKLTDLTNPWPLCQALGAAAFLITGEV